MKPQRAVQSGDAHYYEKTGEKKGLIAPWEDGFRTKGLKGSFEWWYFDSHLEDNSSLVITFFASSGKMRGPSVDVDYTATDGTQYSERITVSVDAFQSSTEGCDLRIGDCWFKGDLHNYDIYLKNDKLEISVQLVGNVPAWRPETGHIFFGNNDEHYFAWLPAVPEGTVTAKISVDGRTTHFVGTGYHDHNWGNSMMKMMPNIFCISQRQMSMLTKKQKSRYTTV